MTPSADSYSGAAANPWREIVPRIYPMCPTTPCRAGSTNPRKLGFDMCIRIGTGVDSYCACNRNESNDYSYYCINYMCITAMALAGFMYT